MRRVVLLSSSLTCEVENVGSRYEATFGCLRGGHRAWLEIEYVGTGQPNPNPSAANAVVAYLPAWRASRSKRQTRDRLARSANVVFTPNSGLIGTNSRRLNVPRTDIERGVVNGNPYLAETIECVGGSTSAQQCGARVGSIAPQAHQQYFAEPAKMGGFLRERDAVGANEPQERRDFE